jgi:hypothetical protein
MSSNPRRKKKRSKTKRKTKMKIKIRRIRDNNMNSNLNNRNNKNTVINLCSNKKTFNSINLSKFSKSNSKTKYKT